MKKNNPFKMTLPYIMIFLIVLLGVISYYFDFVIIKNILDFITIGNLFEIKKLSDTIGMINPLAILNLMLYGFLLGWIFELILRKKK